MNRTKIIVFWVFLIAYMAVSLGFVYQKEGAINCQAIKIEILDSLENHFVEKSVIEDIVKKQNSNILGTNFKKINTDFYENKIRNHPAVKNCEVYKTIDGRLHIELEQRKPIVRVINAKNRHYYIDEEGYVLPLAGKKTSFVLVANGDFKENKEINQNASEHISRFDVKDKRNMLRDIYSIAKYIQSDPFWEAQIVQVYMNKQGEIDLIPRVGAHIISMGTVENMEEKFRNLKAMYIKGFNNIGWNDYVHINLKYKNQVICTKR